AAAPVARALGCQDGYDVGVVQLRRRFGFAAEALHGLGRQTQAAGEHLQRHLAVERHLTRLVDDAHAAPAQLPDELEVPQAAEAFGRAPLGHRIIPSAILACATWLP